MRQRMRLFLLVVGLAIAFPAGASATSAPYGGYNYGYWDTFESPVPYLPERTIRGGELGIGDFREPGDLFVAPDGSVYVLDSGNGRIVVLNSRWELEKVISSFVNEGREETLKSPQGIFVTDDRRIYVADTENRRVVEMNDDGEFMRVIGVPQSDVLRDGFEFYPRKVALDYALRLYVVARGVYDGIMEFDREGEFRGFTGTNRVRFNPLDYFWRMIATEAQREQMQLFLPVEFNNVHIDEEGFLYTTTTERFSNNPIQRLNPSGINVLRAEGHNKPEGDLDIAHANSSMIGPSVFVDIVSGESGMYSALDSRRGRIFTYNEDGDLLYIFGQPGAQAGTFKGPVAVERHGDRMLVLDRDYRHLVVFRPTAYGRAVNEAAGHYHEGREQEAESSWRKVLELNGNDEIAHVGIGKALLRQNRYRDAMESFKLGNNRKYYAKAFTLYRKELLRDHFGSIMTGAVLLALAAAATRRVFRHKRKERTVIHG